MEKWLLCLPGLGGRRGKGISDSSGGVEPELSGKATTINLLVDL